jgi:hypothetical protein
LVGYSEILYYVSAEHAACSKSDNCPSTNDLRGQAGSAGRRRCDPTGMGGRVCCGFLGHWPTRTRCDCFYPLRKLRTSTAQDFDRISTSIPDARSRKSLFRSGCPRGRSAISTTEKSNRGC